VDDGGVPLREEDCFIVIGTGFALQRWVEGQPEVLPKEPGKSLLNPDRLNEEIPKEQWPLNKFTGAPEPPWKVVAFAYLLRPHDAAKFTHINSTWGTRICVRSIRERVRDMGKLRGVSVYPVIRFTSAPMPSKKYPARFRPEFEVLQWRQLGGDQPAQIEPPKQVNQIGKPVQPVTTEEELDDAVGF
jgi:hypothetical protein